MYPIQPNSTHIRRTSLNNSNLPKIVTRIPSIEELERRRNSAGSEELGSYGSRMSVDFKLVSL